MESDRRSDAELRQLAEHWATCLDDELKLASFSAAELTELAERQRAFAQVSDSPGQRRAFLATAAQFEKAARDRVAVGG